MSRASAAADGSPGAPPDTLVSDAQLSILRIAHDTKCLQRQIDEVADRERAALLESVERLRAEAELRMEALRRQAADAIQAQVREQVEAAQRQKAELQAAVRERAERAKRFTELQAAEALTAAMALERLAEFGRREQSELLALRQVAASPAALAEAAGPPRAATPRAATPRAATPRASTPQGAASWASPSTPRVAWDPSCFEVDGFGPSAAHVGNTPSTSASSTSRAGAAAAGDREGEGAAQPQEAYAPRPPTATRPHAGRRWPPKQGTPSRAAAPPRRAVSASAADRRFGALAAAARGEASLAVYCDFVWEPSGRASLLGCASPSLYHL